MSEEEGWEFRNGIVINTKSNNVIIVKNLPGFKGGVSPFSDDECFEIVFTGAGIKARFFDVERGKKMFLDIVNYLSSMEK